MIRRKLWWFAAAAMLFGVSCWMIYDAAQLRRGNAGGSKQGTAALAQPSAGHSLDQMLASGMRAQQAMSGKYEVCGRGEFDRVTQQAAYEAATHALFGEAAAVLERTGLRLMTRSDPGARVAGLVAQYHAEIARAYEAEQKAGAEAQAFKRKDLAPRARGLLEQLVRYSVDSKSPEAWRQALVACANASPAPDVCQSVSWEALAALEPDNAANWLQVATQALQRGDTEARDAAVRRAIAAPRYQSDRLRVSATLAREMDGLASPAVQHAALITAVGIEAALVHSDSPLRIAMAWCPDADRSPVDPARRDECTALGRRMAQADDVGAAGLGYVVQARVLPAGAARDQLRSARRAFDQAFVKSADVNPPGGEFACGHITAVRERFKRIGEIGEAGVARELLAREQAQESKGVAR